ncbi:hypothetical protein [Roseimaritima multifibrata]|uniref:hypothetical protein n=1 Tax=Roseimaritima multifibrata TaxID=1930274 RepID=UPI001C54CD71|nr:hypothetical protein [Roseimaritima multifibrata]
MSIDNSTNCQYRLGVEDYGTVNTSQFTQEPAMLTSSSKGFSKLHSWNAPQNLIQVL